MLKVLSDEPIPIAILLYSFIAVLLVVPIDDNSLELVDDVSFAVLVNELEILFDNVLKALPTLNTVLFVFSSNSSKPFLNLIPNKFSLI